MSMIIIISIIIAMATTSISKKRIATQVRTTQYAWCLNEQRNIQAFFTYLLMEPLPASIKVPWWFIKSIHQISSSEHRKENSDQEKKNTDICIIAAA